VRKVPRDVAMVLGGLLEWACWALWMGEPKMSRFVVLYTCAARWHNIEKARRVLGYEPVIGVEEGIRRTARVSDVLYA
jgi:sterol-4alpha-carboxylate 3-dehydrogenase (decarboxylating)